MTKDRSGAENSGRKSIFSSVWPDREIVQQAAAQFPWGQNVVLMDKIADSHARLWYDWAAAVQGQGSDGGRICIARF